MGEASEYRVGQVVELKNGSVGTIRHLGSTEFADGDWVGIELFDPEGKNDGEVKGKRYFDCPANHGMFLRPVGIEAVLEQAPAPAPKPPSKRISMMGKGAPSKVATIPARPSSMFASAAGRGQSVLDPTFKRHSINAGSPTPISRPVVGRTPPSPARSPTKQPTSRPISLSTISKKSAASNRPGTTSTAAKRTSLMGRPSMAPLGESMGTRPARTSTLSASNGVSRPVPSAPAVHRPANRLSTLQGTSRTTSVSSRTSVSEQESPVEDGNGKDLGDEQVEPPSSTNDNLAKKPLNSGRAVLSPSVNAREPRSPALSRPTTQALSAQNREIDDLKTRLRVMEKKSLENRDKLKEMDRIQGERDRFEGIIQKLQAKIQPQSQEISDLRKQLKETKARAEAAEAQQTDVDEAIELATLDREMAEEMAESCKNELDALRTKHEELVLEVEILRAENEDLGQEMSPEDRNSIGFAQLEKSNERLREALMRLRDITQDTEAELKNRIQELESDIREFSGIQEKFDESQEQLNQAEARAEELKQQLETTQGAEEMIMELTERNMSLTEQMEELKSAIEDLESLKAINDELELNHIEHEKAMQDDIDYREALLLEQVRRSSEQDEVIEELEYTVSRFRELVANLNSDLEDMRASQQITEAEANELSNRSKAMMDINVRLQHSAAKTQIKIIDTELKRLDAQEACDHLAIVQMFLPDTYAQYRDSINAFLRFKRISFKATMLHSFVKDLVNGVAVPGHEENMFVACDILDKLTWISAMCDRFVRFIVSCPIETFARLGSASYDLDPIERAFNGWIESLRRDELKEQQCAADLRRTMSVLEHLAERYLGEGLADYAEDVHMRALLIQSHLENAAAALAHIKAISQARVVLPSDANEEDEEQAQDFLQRADATIAQIRSAQVVAGKALNQLEELRTRSLTLEPSTQASIESTQSSIRDLAVSCRASGIALAALVNEETRTDSLTFEQVTQAIASSDSSPFSSFASRISSTSTALQSFLNLTTTLSQTVEFAAPPVTSLTAESTPWSKLAAEVRAIKSVSANHEAEVARLHDQLSERSTALAMKDKHLSELSVSVEILEKRAADAGKAAGRLRDLEHALESAKRREKDLEARIGRREDELRALRVEREAWITTVGAPGTTTNGVGADPEGVRGPAELSFGNLPVDSVSSKTAAEMAVLRTELDVTQSTVQQLRQAATDASLASAQANGVLSSVLPEVRRGAAGQETAAREHAARNALKLLRGIIDKDDIGILKMKQVKAAKRLKWRPVEDTIAWQVGKKREEWESWKEWANELAKYERRDYKRQKNLEETRGRAAEEDRMNHAEVLARLSLEAFPSLPQTKGHPREICIVNHTEWDVLGRRLGLGY